MAQCALGADVLVVALSVSSIVIGFGPLLVLGRDLYTILAALIAFRYTAAALVAKTVFGQPLESNLQDATLAYLLANLLMLVEVGVILFARRMDKGTSIFPKLPNSRDLRTIGLSAFGIGLGASVVAALLTAREGDAISSGPAFIIAFSLSSLLFLGLSAEMIARHTATGGREVISSRLCVMLALMVALALAVNTRAIIFNSALTVFLAAFMLRALRLKHVLIAAAAGFVFANYVSPLSLELRTIRSELSATEFASEVVETVVKAATDPSFMAEIQARSEFRDRFETGTLMYDYFKLPTIASRAAFIGIIDAVAARLKVDPPIGLEALDQVAQRVVPSFLMEREIPAYGHGDWLSWRLGLIEIGRISYLNFCLPMEGLAVFGISGFVLYPLIFMLPVLLVCGRISSLRVTSATSLFIFSSLQWYLIEGTSDIFTSILIRTLPLMIVPAYGLYWLIVQHRLMRSPIALPSHRQAIASPRAQRESVPEARSAAQL